MSDVFWHPREGLGLELAMQSVCGNPPARFKAWGFFDGVRWTPAR